MTLRNFLYLLIEAAEAKLLSTACVYIQYSCGRPAAFYLCVEWRKRRIIIKHQSLERNDAYYYRERYLPFPYLDQPAVTACAVASNYCDLMHHFCKRGLPLGIHFHFTYLPTYLRAREFLNKLTTSINNLFRISYFAYFIQFMIPDSRYILL